MSVLFRSRKSPESTGTPDELRSFTMAQLGAMVSASYAEWTPKVMPTIKAMTHSGVYACVDILASTIGQLPADCVRYVDDERKREPHQLVDNPSALVEPDAWRYQVAYGMIDDGNSWGLVVERSGRGLPITIETLCASEVTERDVVNGVLTVKYENKQLAKFPHGDLMHIPGKMIKPGSPFGESPVQAALETVSAAVAARAFGANFFTDGVHPSIAAFTDEDISPETAERMKQQIMQMSKRREPGVFGNGWDLKTYHVNPTDSQFIDLMRFVIEECARFFRVPPQMIYAAVSGQAVTYANATQADMAFLKYSIEPYLVRIERGVSRLMERPKQFRFNRDAFLRMDPVTRWKISDLRLRHQSTSVNEVRKLNDEKPFDDPEFDEPGFPALTAKAEAATPDGSMEDDEGETPPKDQGAADA